VGEPVGTDLPLPCYFKVEASDFGLQDRLAKRTGCVIIILHHDSKTAASGRHTKDWSS